MGKFETFKVEVFALPGCGTKLLCEEWIMIGDLTSKHCRYRKRSSNMMEVEIVVEAKERWDG